MFRIRREVLEGGATEPARCSKVSTQSGAEDVQRVAQDVIGRNAINLAVIGPFEDNERFEEIDPELGLQLVEVAPMSSRSSSVIAASASRPRARFA